MGAKKIILLVEDDPDDVKAVKHLGLFWLLWNETPTAQIKN